MRRRWVWWLIAGTGLALLGTFALEQYQSALSRATAASALPAIAGYDVREAPEQNLVKPGVKLLWAVPKPKHPRGNRLFLLVDGKPREITAFADFSGQLRLRSCADASDFITRFLSLSDSQWHHLQRQTVPVGQPTLLTGSTKGPPLRMEGTVTEDDWSRNGLAEPEARQKPDGYTVTEWLWTVKPDLGGFQDGAYSATTWVYRVAFHVTSDGRVREEIVTKKKLVGLELVATTQGAPARG